MKMDFRAAMRHATKLAGAQNVIEATRAIQRSLLGREPADQATPEGSRLSAPSTNVAGELEVFELAPHDAKIAGAQLHEILPERPRAPRIRMPLGEVLKVLRQADLPSLHRGPASFAKSRKGHSTPVPDGAIYLTRTFACEAGSRDYKIYVPSNVGTHKRSLIVMLHGCTQDPDDFAVGTGMNQLAEEHGFIVAYPKQSVNANQTACWNWFSLADQRRDAGEPSIIAGITRTIMVEFNIDARRVYVAGLSAGGAMAANMSATYPELYAATGIHSGLPHGAATDVISALSVMRSGSNAAAPALNKVRSKGADKRVRTIVFHGASDQTVHPSNSEVIFAEARADLTHPAQVTRHDGSTGGRAYTRRVIVDADGHPHAEHWAIEGLGHAWSGGNPDGSYTDQHGPDASREMLRFFTGIPD